MRTAARWATAAVIAYAGGVGLAYVIVAWARHTDTLADFDAETVTAVFVQPIGPGKLDSVCPNPLADKQGDDA